MEQNNKIKLLIADDHEIYLEGLKGFLSKNEKYELMGQAKNGVELVRMAQVYKPQIIITDLKMPMMDGPSAIRTILRTNNLIKFLVLTSYENETSIVEALEAGAKGYLTKNMPKKELFEALDSVSHGYPYYCLATSTKMVKLIARSSFNPYRESPAIHFSDAEKKVIRLVCEEYDNKQISEKLFMSVRTVEKNRSSILKKIGAKTTAGIAIYAIKHSLYFIDD